MKGNVKSIRKNFGFIRGEDNKEYYFNENSLVGDLAFQGITKDMDVEFDIQRQSDGKLKAVNVEYKIINFFKEHVLDLSVNKDQYDAFCDHAKKYAERLKEGNVKTTMIRKIYARILNARSVTDLKLLRPHFAYTSGRNERNPILREFMDLLDYLVKQMDIKNEQHLVNFKQFMEAIVAYRRYFGDDK